MRETNDPERSPDRRCAEGWIVFRVTPWAVLGPFAAFDDAVQRAESMGPHFLIAYGAREKGVPDFVPREEPDISAVSAA